MNEQAAMMRTLLAQDFSPFGERVLVAAVGPFVTGVFGTGIIAFAVFLLQRKVAERDKMQAEKRERAEKRAAQERTDNALRRELVADMTTAAVKLYLALQHFKRKNRAALEGPTIDVTHARVAVDDQYLETILAGNVLEAKLRAFYVTPEAAVEWHKVMDLLTIRYFQLIGEDTSALYRANTPDRRNGNAHSGLSFRQLHVPKVVIDAYRDCLASSTREVLNRPLKESYEESIGVRLAVVSSDTEHDAVHRPARPGAGSATSTASSAPRPSNRRSEPGVGS